MLINWNKPDNYLNFGHIKFIEYTGKWPRLCVGILTLEIDGIPYKFGVK